MPKRKSEMVPKPGLPKKPNNKGTQTKKKIQKDAKAQNATMSALYTKQQNPYSNMIVYTTHNMEKKVEQKERNYRAIFSKRAQILEQQRRSYLREPI